MFVFCSWKIYWLYWQHSSVQLLQSDVGEGLGNIFNLVWKPSFIFKIPVAQNSLSYSESNIVSFK